MTQSVLGRLRRFWLDVHLWIGVGLLIALVPIGVSGALLVWHDPLDELIHPHRFAVGEGDATLAPSAYLAAAQAAVAGRASVSQIRLPEAPGEPVVASARIDGQTLQPGQRPVTLTVWLDPATGKVLDVANTRDEFINIMHRLHGSLLIPGQGIGRKVVGWMGWAMTVSCLTGLWLWWPRNGAVLKALRWRRSPSTMNNLHHLFGFWILIPLLVVSLTGIYISFPQTSRALFGVAQPQAGPGDRRASAPRPAQNAPPLARTLTPIDAAVTAARLEKPGLELASIALPTEGGRPAWRVQFRAEGQPQPVTVQVGDRTGEVGQGRAGANGPGQPDPLSRLMRQIHDGQKTPFIWQVLVVLTGIAPPLLGITGTVMWLRRRSRRRHLQRLQAGGPQ